MTGDTYSRRSVPMSTEIRLFRPAGRLPARLVALFRVYADAWREQWPGAGPDGLGHRHRGWIGHRAFWGSGTAAVLRYRYHFVAALTPQRPNDRARIADWLLADLHRQRSFFGALRRELLTRSAVDEFPRVAERAWRAGMTTDRGACNRGACNRE